MAPCKPNPAADPKPPVLAAKVAKTTPKRLGNAKAKNRNHSTKKPNTYRKKRYRNGILNLEQTPVHLVDAVKHNAESPLLRLPPEIRNRVWSLAMGGQLVKLPLESSQTVKPMQVLWFENLLSVDKSVAPIRPASALHLPEVCRQIY
ncbi:beta transducin [Neodidymelliopsis sp. IMI 364377]|nr:beta transducin [Neodidymelliopsis sp. IMI 364377]